MVPNPVVNLDGNGLKIEWDIERTRSSTPDQGTVTIYNLSPSSRKILHEAWKLSTAVASYLVDLSIGWGGLVERVFVGDVWKIVPEVRVGEDVLTVLELGDGGPKLRDAANPKQANMNNAQITFILLVLVEADPSLGGLGLPIDPISRGVIEARARLSPFLGFDNYAGQGNTADQLDELMDMLDLEWKIHQGVFIVMAAGNAATASVDAIPLVAASGMLSWSQEDNGGITATALANANVKPGTQIQVQDSFGPVGLVPYRVERVSFTGATDGESIMQITARKSVLL